ncbi:hypothetical protein [Dyadobacter diqingensis]|uniref:hypothetical protein n=1 Tax=Dyadobacter diqingensis TaxID=2938121 RepID=UPI0020C4FA75|nr:hypothetical protein [Dyadobacter diqingensis]
MSNLTVRDVYAITVPEQIKSKLKKSEESIIALSIPSQVNPLVKDLNGDQMKGLVDAIVKKAALMLGQKANDPEEQEEVNIGINLQILKFQNLTAGEIMRALEYGLEGRYVAKGGFVYFTPSHFVQWVRSYEEDVRLPVKGLYREIERGLPTPTYEPTESDKVTLSWNFFTWVIQVYLKERVYVDAGNSVFNFLTKIGFLVLTDEEWNRAVAITNDKLIKDLSGNIQEKKKVIARIKEMESGAFDENIDSKVRQTVISERLEEFYKMDRDDQFDYMEAVLEKVNYAKAQLENQ